MAQHLGSGDLADTFRGSPLYMVNTHTVLALIVLTLMFEYYMHVIELRVVKSIVNYSDLWQLRR